MTGSDPNLDDERGRKKLQDGRGITARERARLKNKTENWPLGTMA